MGFNICFNFLKNQKKRFIYQWCTLAGEICFHTGVCLLLLGGERQQVSRALPICARGLSQVSVPCLPKQAAMRFPS